MTPPPSDGHVLVMAKSPVPGRVKTRLCPPFSPDDAAAVAAAALADTLEAVAACQARRKVIALDGEPGPWLPPGFELFRQRGGGLDERLANAWADAAGAGIQIGMDTPQVHPGQLDRLLGLLDGQGRLHGHRRLDGQGRPAVLGHARDGGWWVIGLPAGTNPCAVFAGVPMSTPVTGAHQERRLRSLGFAVVHAPLLRDVDTAADLAALARAAPGTRTAALARRLGIGAEVA
jgi:glycosyltransferase A (GT-A) superfamily protein (DUF2064 family)